MRNSTGLELSITSDGEWTLSLPADFDYTDDNLENVASLLEQARAVAGAR